MKLLFVMHNNDYYSGANLAMREVIEDLRDYTEHEISVLYPQKGGTADQYFLNHGISIYYADYWPQLLSGRDSFVKNALKYPLMLLRSFKMKHSVERLADLVNNIDLIYTNTCTIKFGLMLSQTYHKPHIWHIREFGDKDHCFIYPLGKRKYFNQANKIKSEVVTISKCLLEERRAYFDEARLHLIYDNVGMQYINLQKSDIPEGQLNILSAGDIKEGKGQLVAVKAMAIIQKMTCKNIRLYIAGKIGDQAYLEKIKALIVAEQLHDTVQFLGHVDNMNQLRRNMNVGIVSSISEAFGRVTVEGMLSRMAMIGRNSGATVEIIEDHRNGLLYDGTAEDLAAKILQLHNSEFRSRIAEQGFNDATRLYLSGSCSRAVNELIKKTYAESGDFIYG